MNINGALLRLPAFTYDIATWFIHIEALWAGSPDIRVSLSFMHALVSAIPSDVAARISSVLTTPPADGKYEAVKTALVCALGRSCEAYVAELDTLQYYGRRPSAFLSRMLDLNRVAGFPLSGDMLHYRHTSLMPHAVRVQLAGLRGPVTINEYSELVDKIHAAYTSFPPPLPTHHSCACSAAEGVRVPAVFTPSDTPAGSPKILSALERPGARGDHGTALAHSSSTDARLSDMASAIQRLQAAFSALHSPTSRKYCYYHGRFGAAVRNCQPPCSWSGNYQRGSR
ncbi:hypothetical protein GWK47_011451 [Chionoecetes opilio]|uniref:Uncharacterized protein n=1 Tax=Chionoecetes opilio TaxID=41210 RepID=A0A8J4Y2T5_CHIOP|nr:hypothetical protein GWK47_011451 [Chionoecetes opilio]